MHVYIIGLGDIGHRIARLELGRGRNVSALVRTDAKIKETENLGIKVFHADLDQPDTLERQPLHGAIVYYLAPPPSTGKHDSRMRNWLKSIKPFSPAKVVYISTTGVYGDCRGEWVDEQRPPRPKTDRAKRRLDAENQLAGWGQKQGVPVVRLRVPGIYHPDRLPIEALRRGRPVLRMEDAPYTNHIHADDLARICLAAADRGAAGEIYNVADNDASTMSEYFIKIADALGMPRPREIGWEEAERQLSPAMLSYLRESRRISNKKMLDELGVELLHPTLDITGPSA
ncbi:MAG TPA: SDR family oxidoreductase [Sedimenticola sp.]|nr:SDR family oxidoreductase [Sedimenticola sp.]